MRQIGTLPGTLDPKILGDHLVALGISSRAIESPEGWAIWIHNEDQMEKARGEFDAFLKEPESSRFQDASDAASKFRREQERLDKQYRKNVKGLSGTWDGLNVRRRPLTMILTAICVVLFVAGQTSISRKIWLVDRLAFFPIMGQERPDDLKHGLDAIEHGEVWRIITPIFLHGSLLHLLFNLWALTAIGTLIESRRGTKTMAAIVFFSAVASNVGQYLYMINFERFLVPWVGISGVVYALFGYIWMKGQYEPEQGMILPGSAVRVMLIWLLLGFTSVLPVNMANGAHVMGLVVGMLFGLARI